MTIISARCSLIAMYNKIRVACDQHRKCRLSMRGHRILLINICAIIINRIFASEYREGATKKEDERRRRPGEATTEKS